MSSVWYEPKSGKRYSDIEMLEMDMMHVNNQLGDIADYTDSMLGLLDDIYRKLDDIEKLYLPLAIATLANLALLGVVVWRLLR